MIIFHAQGFNTVNVCFLDQMFRVEADAIEEVHHLLTGHWKRGEEVAARFVEGTWEWYCEDGSRYVIEPRTVH